jgi:hypothetical protein
MCARVACAFSAKESRPLSRIVFITPPVRNSSTKDFVAAMTLLQGGNTVTDMEAHAQETLEIL